MTDPAWLTRLEADAPDVVACWRALDDTLAGLRRIRRELRARVHLGDAERILAQQEHLAGQLDAMVRAIPENLLRAPGGEGDWNVAQTFAHTTAARRFLAAWAAGWAAGEWSRDDPPVVRPSVPGRPDATRDELLVLLDKSRRSQFESAAKLAGHETDRCPLDHPTIGRLRCGDWLVFVGVHDLMHLEQLHRLAGDEAS